MPANDTKRFAVLLPEADKRRLKTLAASRGLTLQEALHQAFEAWAAQLQARALAPDPLQGALAGADSEKPGAPDQAATFRRDQRLAEAKCPSTPVGRQLPGLQGGALLWFQQAGRLDWAKCSAVARVPTGTGNTWVVRATSVPVAHIFQRFAEGCRFGEIAEELGLSPEQMNPILQFAAEAGLFPGGVP